MRSTPWYPLSLNSPATEPMRRARRPSRAAPCSGAYTLSSLMASRVYLTSPTHLGLRLRPASLVALPRDSEIDSERRFDETREASGTTTHSHGPCSSRTLRQRVGPVTCSERRG